MMGETEPQAKGQKMASVSFVQYRNLRHAYLTLPKRDFSAILRDNNINKAQAKVLVSSFKSNGFHRP